MSYGELEPYQSPDPAAVEAGLLSAPVEITVSGPELVEGLEHLGVYSHRITLRPAEAADAPQALTAGDDDAVTLRGRVEALGSRVVRQVGGGREIVEYRLRISADALPHQEGEV